MIRRSPLSTLFPYTTLFRSWYSFCCSKYVDLSINHSYGNITFSKRVKESVENDFNSSCEYCWCGCIIVNSWSCLFWKGSNDCWCSTISRGCRPFSNYVRGSGSSRPYEFISLCYCHLCCSRFRWISINLDYVEKRRKKLPKKVS